MSFFEYRPDDRMYVKSDILENSGMVNHGFSSRLGGVSRGIITGLNLGFRVNDSENSVKENYNLLARDLGIELDKTVLAKQTHTDNIRIVTNDDMGKGITRESDIEDTDGLVCNIPEIALVVFSADCVPVLLFDPIRKVVAAVHAGWRGTVKQIAAKCVKLMEDCFGSRPENILAAIGPSIGPCCFEVGEDTVANFGKEYITEKPNGKYNINLWAHNRNGLVRAGLLPENIDICKRCTVCENDRFYSYRSHRDKTGRQAAVIMLKG